MTALETCSDYWGRFVSTGQLPESAPRWPQKGLALEGDFAGIQGFVLKPVPGSKGAAKRLRARSYRVIATSRVVANTICREFSAENAKVYFSAGGHILLFCELANNWRERLAKLQIELDRRLFAEFSGEVAFHVAGAEFGNGKIPVEPLRNALEIRRATPQSGALLSAGLWREDAFVAKAEPGWFKCPACLRTTHDAVAVAEEGEERICVDCAEDIRLGTDLAHGGGTRITLADLQGVLRWHPLRRDRAPMTFEDIAAECCGERKFLGYLRLDVDRAGLQFQQLAGDPARIWLLSHFLDMFFATHVQELLVREFRSLYPVYGGGDDLFLVGAWDQSLSFLKALLLAFQKVSNGRLTFSAGVALAKPHQHILTYGNKAADALAEAKDAGRDRVKALGVVIPASEFPRQLTRAAEIRDWLEQGFLTTAFLQNLRHLWVQSRGITSREAVGMHQAILHYQIARNLSKKSPPEVTAWAKSLRREDSDFKYVPFLAGSALLARQAQGGKHA